MSKKLVNELEMLANSLKSEMRRIQNSPFLRWLNALQKRCM